MVESGNLRERMARMTAIPLVDDEVYYPESDGEPMAETPIHGNEMVYVFEALEQRYRASPHVFVGYNMFFYYRKGDPTGVVAPDNLVVKGVPKLLPGGQARRTLKLWQEGQVPCFVLEVTSLKTRAKDEEKKTTYEQLAIPEYFQFDPCGEYLRPPLQGLRLAGDRYRPVRPNPDGSLLSRTLGVIFKADRNQLKLYDAATGELYLRRAELEEKAAAEAQARRQAEEKAAAEAQARRQAEARNRALEEELARLRHTLGEA